MNMYDRILIPVGLKTDMKLALGMAVRLLNPDGDITILYVIPSDKLPVTAVEWRKAMGVISQAQSISLEKNIEINYKVKNNLSIARGILKEATSTDYGLLLMTNPRAERRGILFGRKIDEIVRNTPVETAILTYSSSQPVTCKKILIPTSGYRHALRAARLAEVLAKEYGSEITVMYVGTRKDDADAVLKPLVSDLEANGVKGRPLFKSGPIAQTILDEARQGYDLMMIGATERPAYQEFLLGSTADRLVHDAPCAVLMVKTTEKTY
jgi:nucleotide-binding universal stress UspA family protein